jgi:putative SOS response-associated peptidase YedK
VLTMADLWDRWTNVETKEQLLSCTMLITEPNRFVAEVHDRMPVILRPEQFDAWLDGSMGVDDIKTPITDDFLRRRRVARRVNSSRARNDDATLIDEAA